MQANNESSAKFDQKSATESWPALHQRFKAAKDNGHQINNSLSSDEGAKTSDFEKNYDDYFNQLRSAATFGNIDQIKSIQQILTPEQYFQLLLDKNWKYSECAIIHYAARYNQPSAIHALIDHCSMEQRLAVLASTFNTGCTTLHFAATEDNKDRRCSYEASIAIKELLYNETNPSYWFKLLAMQQLQLETAVHYAARLPTATLLYLFSQGLSATDWLAILSLKNKLNRTALETYFINMSKVIDGSQQQFFNAFKGSSSDNEWIDFLRSNHLIEALKASVCCPTIIKHCLDLIHAQDISVELKNNLLETELHQNFDSRSIKWDNPSRAIFSPS